MIGVRFASPHPGLRPEEVVGTFPATPGLYLHVPFCRSLCPFCPYNKVRYQPDLAEAYFPRLLAEAKRYLEVLPGPFPSLYVGGGTPTLDLAALVPILDRIPVTGERAIEALPDHLRDGGAARVRAAGFDFVSVGVQSFHDDVLRRLRRPGSGAGNRAAVAAAAGSFTCVDVDLIFDAAYDRPGVLLSDLAECFRLGVDQVSAYPLMRFGYTPFGKGRHDRRREHAVLAEAADLAADHGYERRAVWTFNRVGSPSYTSITRPYYLGLGAGSATFAGTRFLVNHFGLQQYGAAIDAGRLPVARVAHLAPPAAAAYRAFWQAYTGRIPLDGTDPLLRHPAAVGLRTASRVAGWSRRQGGAVVVTGRGYDRYHDLERWVTYHLIEPLWAGMMDEHRAAGASRESVR